MPSIILIYANNKSVPVSKTAYLEIKQAKEVLYFGGLRLTSKQV